VGTFGSVYLLVVVLGMVLAIAWIILPFAMIGTKSILRQLLAEQKKTNELLNTRLPVFRPPQPPTV